MSTESTSTTTTTTTTTSSTTPLEAAQSVVSDGFQSMSAGGRTVQNLSINDLISLDKHQKNSDLGTNPAAGLRPVCMRGGSTRF